MREILFRGKDDLSSLWNIGSLVKLKDENNNEQYHIVRQDKGYVIANPETVGQYTGLKDRNGIKIFEGDIIQNIANGFFGIVKWYDEHAAFVIHGINDNKTYWLFDNDFSKVRIVGNIYDNPELLEVKNG